MGQKRCQYCDQTNGSMKSFLHLKKKTKKDVVFTFFKNKYFFTSANRLIVK